VSFQVDQGQIMGFLGPNGAGKSTTLRVLTGFLPGDSGTVRVAGFDVRTHSLDVRRVTGYLPEGVPLYPEMRVNEYLDFRARLKGLLGGKRRAAMDRVIEEAGISEVRRRLVGTLSRGYRQRVGLADALLGEPKVLILDEPTVGLDPSQVRQFRQLLHQIGKDRTVILSTHILGEVELVCSHVTIINKGRIVARDTTDGLRRRFGSSRKTLVEISGPVEEIHDALRKDPRVTALTMSQEKDGFHRFSIISDPQDDLREMAYQVARDGGWRLRDLRCQMVSLEDLFVGIVGESEEGEA